jgi:hypothetical protein
MEIVSVDFPQSHKVFNMENAKFGYTSTLQSKLKKLTDLIFLLNWLLKMHDLIFLLNRLLKMHMPDFAEKNPNSITKKKTQRGIWQKLNLSGKMLLSISTIKINQPAMLHTKLVRSKILNVCNTSNCDTSFQKHIVSYFLLYVLPLKMYPIQDFFLPNQWNWLKFCTYYK